MEKGRDRPENVIEITPQMIEAGVQQLLWAYPDTAMGGHVDEKLVVDIFRAMKSGNRQPVAGLSW